MKKVALFKSAVLVLLACVGIAACNNDATEVPTDPETHTVKLSWAGEIIDVSYEPLTRATTDDLYGIQVYSKPQNAGDDTDWVPYAYGLFDDPDDITITLAAGYKYKFVATMVKDGKNKVQNNSGYYYDPFSTNSSTNPFQCALTNKFDYQRSIFFKNASNNSLMEGSTFIKTLGAYNRPNVERFYGELSNYIPNDGTNLKIDMKRTSFGAKFIAGGKLAVDGKLEIQIDGAPKMELALTAGADEISDIFTFYDVDAAWANNNYTEDINVSLNWIRPDGSAQPLGTHEITFKRNTTTIVEVNIDKDGNDEGVDLDIPSSETGNMAEGSKVTITDGVMQ